MATTRNNNRYTDMAWRPVAKQIMKYGGAALVGIEVKDVIDAKSTNEEKIISKIIEKSVKSEGDDISLSKTNALIFIVLFVILMYLAIKHILKRRNYGELNQV